MNAVRNLFQTTFFIPVVYTLFLRACKIGKVNRKSLFASSTESDAHWSLLYSEGDSHHSISAWSMDANQTEETMYRVIKNCTLAVIDEVIVDNKTKQLLT